MKARIIHAALALLGAATVALTVLQKFPKYAAIAGGLLMLVADARTIVKTLDVVKTMVVAMALLSLTSCAHLTNIGRSCEPSTADEVRIVSELAREDWAAALAPEVECVIRAVVAQVLAPPSGQALTAASGPDMTVVRAHAAAWSQTH